jgi:putative transposase
MVLSDLHLRRCKYCNSYHVVRYGYTKGKMIRLLCRDCRHTFMDSDSMPGMKTPANHVAAAVSMYYEGMSLNAIRRQLQQEHNIFPSDSTIYEWIVRYTRMAMQKTKDFKPNVGDIWIIDGTELNIQGKPVWFGDIMDGRTRFFLASHMSTNLNLEDVKTLVNKAYERAGKNPKIIVSDKLSAYVNSIEPNFKTETKHSARQKTGITAKQSAYKQFYGSQKARNKVIRGLKKLESAQLLLDGWQVHYNFFRPNEAIKQFTPAEFARTNCPFKKWLDIVRPPHI